MITSKMFSSEYLQHLHMFACTDCDSVCNAVVQSFALHSMMFDILCD